MAALKALVVFGLAVVAAGLVYGYGTSKNADDSGTSQPRQEIRFGEFDLALEVRDGSCTLAYRSDAQTGELPLLIDGPCRFIRPDNGDMQVFRENNIEVFAVVGGSEENNVLGLVSTERFDCGTQLAGVIFSEDAFRLSDYRPGSGRFCALLKMEQKDFWLLLNG